MSIAYESIATMVEKRHGFIDSIKIDPAFFLIFCISVRNGLSVMDMIGHQVVEGPGCFFRHACAGGCVAIRSGRVETLRYMIG